MPDRRQTAQEKGDDQAPAAVPPPAQPAPAAPAAPQAPGVPPAVQAPPPVVATPAPPVAPPPAPAPARPQPVLPPEELYKTALSDYTKGDYDLAITGFRGYLQTYPRTSLAPNAQYWLAECYFSQKSYKQAIEEFDVKGLMRSGATDEEIEALIRSTVDKKWLGHEINNARFAPPPRPMYAIGG